MNQLHGQMVQRKFFLQNLKNEIESQAKSLPQGKLRINNTKGIPRYYCITEAKDTRGKYISKKEQELAYQLAQKDYLQKLYQKVCGELADIEAFLQKHKANELEEVYGNLNSYRKNIIAPIVITDEMYALQWMNEDYESNPYWPEQKVYPTKKDDMVRSKSEVLLADMYYELGIPYRYEALLQLKSGKKRYPDFTLLKTNTREVIYHEHLGLMDDNEYRRSNLWKLDEYPKNGIYPGKT